MKEATDLLLELERIEFDATNFEISLRAITECIIVEFQGPLGLAKELVLLYRTPRTPVATKAQILQGVLRLLEKCEGMGRVAEKIPEEFKEAFEDLASRAAEDSEDDDG